MVKGHVRWPWDVVKVAEAVCSHAAPSTDPGHHASFLVVEGLVSGAIQATLESLPARVFKHKGRDFSVLECPGPGFAGDEKLREKIALGTGDLHQWDYWIGRGIPEEPDTKDFDSALNLVLNLRKDPWETRRKRKPCDWQAVSEKKNVFEDTDKAPHALIVDVAEEVSGPLESVSERPKKALRRVRDLERIQKVRELDTACFIDLCRRPGMSVAEKAGPRQRLKAVRRFESIDILENRVARHTMRLASICAARYLDAYGDKVTSARVKAVRHFETRLRRLQNNTDLGRLHCPITPVRVPNYVLLENPVYRKIWENYQELIREEEVRAAVWRWRRRFWADAVGLQLADALTRWAFSSGCTPVAEKRVVYGEYQFTAGNFLESDCMPGPFIVSTSAGTATIWAVDHEGLMQLRHGPEFAFLNADYYILVQSESDCSVVPIYAVDSGYVKAADPQKVLSDALEAATLGGNSVRGVAVIAQSRECEKLSESRAGCEGVFLGAACDAERLEAKAVELAGVIGMLVNRAIS